MQKLKEVKQLMGMVRLVKYNFKQLKRITMQTLSGAYVIIVEEARTNLFNS